MVRIVLKVGVESRDVDGSIPYQNVQARHMRHKASEWKRSIPGWYCSIRLASWTNLPL
jgi:hypothetical protein